MANEILLLNKIKDRARHCAYKVFGKSGDSNTDINHYSLAKFVAHYSIKFVSDEYAEDDMNANDENLSKEFTTIYNSLREVSVSQKITHSMLDGIKQGRLRHKYINAEFVSCLHEKLVENEFAKTQKLIEKHIV